MVNHDRENGFRKKLIIYEGKITGLEQRIKQLEQERTKLES